MCTHSAELLVKRWGATAGRPAATREPTMPLAMPSCKSKRAVSRRSWLSSAAAGRKARAADSRGVLVKLTRHHRLHTGWCAASTSADSCAAVVCRAGAGQAVHRAGQGRQCRLANQTHCEDCHAHTSAHKATHLDEQVAQGLSSIEEGKDPKGVC